MISPNRTEMMWLALGLVWFFLVSPLLMVLSMQLGLWPKMSFWIVLICFSGLGFADGGGALSLLAPCSPRDGDGRSGGYGDLDWAGDPAGPGASGGFSLGGGLRRTSRGCKDAAPILPAGVDPSVDLAGPDGF